MKYFIVVVPVNGKPYIADYIERINLDKFGSECNFYSIFKCNGCIGYKLVAYILYNNYDEYKNYDYKNNRTCEIEIYNIDEYNRDKYLGYTKKVAEIIIKNIEEKIKL